MPVSRYNDFIAILLAALGSTRCPSSLRRWMRMGIGGRRLLAHAIAYSLRPTSWPGRSVLLQQRAGGGRERPECLFAAHLLDELVIVPGVLRFGRRLHLHHVHVVHHQAVQADVAVG